MFDIDLQSRIPIYEQLYRKIVELAVQGVLAEGSQIPSVRQLAKDLCVNPNTVSKAYQNLERDGVIYSLSGRGSFIGSIRKADIHTDLLEEFDHAAEAALRAGVEESTLQDHVLQLAKEFSAKDCTDEGRSEQHD